MQCDTCGEQSEEVWYTLTQFGQPDSQHGETVSCERCTPDSITLTPNQLCLICRRERVDPRCTLRVRFAANRIVRLQLLCGAECREVAEQQLRAMMDELGVHDANEQKEDQTAAVDEGSMRCSACREGIDDGGDTVFATTLFGVPTSVEGHNQRVSLTVCSRCLPHIQFPINRYCLTCAERPVDETRTVQVTFVHLRMVVRKEVCDKVECRSEQLRDMHEQLDEDGLYRQDERQEETSQQQ